MDLLVLIFEKGIRLFFFQIKTGLKRNGRVFGLDDILKLGKYFITGIINIVLKFDSFILAHEFLDEGFLLFSAVAFFIAGIDLLE
jgi:hypothetical protein